MRKARGLVQACFFLSSISVAPACVAQTFCNPFNVEGNETEAPTAFLQAFQNRDWTKMDGLLIDNVEFSYIDYEPKIVKGRVDVVGALKLMYDQNLMADMIGYNFGKIDLKAGHWVSARLYPKFRPPEVQPEGKRMGPPPLPPPHPSHYPAYSISFLPDCRGKIVSFFVVDRDLVSD